MGTLFTFLIFVPLCALLWRLGGGAFTTLTGIELGTDTARLFRIAPALIYVIAFCSPWTLLAPAALLVGLMISGWGPFQGMGLPSPNMPEQSWLRWLPERFGLKIGTLGHDFVGMAEAGMVCMWPLALLVFFPLGFASAAILIVAGLGFAPCYLLARRGFPTIPHFAEGQSWGEVFTGALIGAALVLSIL
jgi:hypothetical protein